MTHVTNGVHMPTWDSAEADQPLGDVLVGRTAGVERRKIWKPMFACVSDSDLWQLRTDGRKSLVEYVRKRHTSGRSRAKARSSEELSQAAQVLDANTLTLGFARRFAPYKRPNLLLHDPQRLVQILTNRDRPVQLVLAGKAHPQDVEGQEMIRQWIEFAYRPEVRSACGFPERLRCADGGALGPGRRRVGEHSATPLGSERHERHEGARQRWTESFGARRLVGGSVFARSRLGHR